MARVYGEGAQLFSRPGNQLSTRFPEITMALATALDGRAAILDGEIVTPDRTGAPSFQLLQRRLAVPSPRPTLQASIPSTLCVFDILNLDGADLTQLPYLQRRAILEDLPLRDTNAIAVPPAGSPIRQSRNRQNSNQLVGRCRVPSRHRINRTQEADYGRLMDGGISRLSSARRLARRVRGLPRY
jgi:ATP-dependent DNA ligase